MEIGRKQKPLTGYARNHQTLHGQERRTAAMAQALTSTRTEAIEGEGEARSSYI